MVAINNEADLTRTLILAALKAGWNAGCEVPLGQAARADILLNRSDRLVLIEVKHHPSALAVATAVVVQIPRYLGHLPIHTEAALVTDRFPPAKTAFIEGRALVDGHVEHATVDGRQIPIHLVHADRLVAHLEAH